jgi:serine/threonine protein kinase
LIFIKLQNHIKFIGPYHKGIVNIYGISQDPNTKEYVLVMRYAAEGDFKKYLKSNYTGWNDKIKKLYNIISGLNTLHQEKLIHSDFHSGNILYFQYLSETMIADLGLSGPADQETSSKNDIVGVLPYIAPEVLNKKPYTQKSDIYSFGILMSETSTHQQPFKDQPHDIDLAFKICGGLRPSFSDNTPECYIKLAYKCTDADPEKRPTADEILKIIAFWKDAIEEDQSNWPNYSEEQLDELEEIRKIFEEANKKPFNPSTIMATIHPNAIYTSRLLNFTNLPQPVNSNKVTIISNNNGNYLIYCYIFNLIIYY